MSRTLDHGHTPQTRTPLPHHTTPHPGRPPHLFGRLLMRALQVGVRLLQSLLVGRVHALERLKVRELGVAALRNLVVQLLLQLPDGTLMAEKENGYSEGLGTREERDQGDALCWNLSNDGRECLMHDKKRQQNQTQPSTFFRGNSTLMSTRNTHWTHERIHQTHGTALCMCYCYKVGYLQLHELLAVVRDLVSRLVELRGRGLGLSLPLVALRLRLGQLGLRGRLRSNSMRAHKSKRRVENTRFTIIHDNSKPIEDTRPDYRAVFCAEKIDS